VVMSHHQNTGQDHNLQVNSMEKSLFWEANSHLSSQ
jgi:hypothetical protein